MHIVKYLLSFVLLFNQVALYAIPNKSETVTLEEFNNRVDIAIKRIEKTISHFDTEVIEILQNRVGRFSIELDQYVDLGPTFPSEFNFVVGEIRNIMNKFPPQFRKSIEMILTKNGPVPLDVNKSKKFDPSLAIGFKKRGVAFVDELKKLTDKESFYKNELLKKISIPANSISQLGQSYPEAYKEFKRRYNQIIMRTFGTVSPAEIEKVKQTTNNKMEKESKQEKEEASPYERHADKVSVQEFENKAKELIDLVKKSKKKLGTSITKTGEKWIKDYLVSLEEYADWGLKYPLEYNNYLNRMKRIISRGIHNSELKSIEDKIFKHGELLETDPNDESEIDEVDRNKFFKIGELHLNKFRMLNDMNNFYQGEVMRIYIQKYSYLTEIGKHHPESYAEFKRDFDKALNELFPLMKIKPLTVEVEETPRGPKDPEEINEEAKEKQNIYKDSLKSLKEKMTANIFTAESNQIIVSLLNIDFTKQDELKEYYLELNEKLVKLNHSGSIHPQLYNQFMVQFEELLHHKLIAYIEQVERDSNNRENKKEIINKALKQFKKYVFTTHKTLKDPLRKAIFNKAASLALMINVFIFTNGTVPQGLLTSFITLFGFEYGMSNGNNIFNRRKMNKWFNLDALEKFRNEVHNNQHKTLVDLENKVAHLITNIQERNGDNYYEKLNELTSLIKGVKKEKRFSAYQKGYYSQVMMIGFYKGLENIYSGEALQEAQKATVEALNIFNLVEGNKLIWTSYMANTIFYGLFVYTLFSIEALTWANGFLLFVAYYMSTSLFDKWRRRNEDRSPFTRNKEGTYEVDKFKLYKYCQDLLQSTK